jgi:hypothetical protein
MKMQVIVIPASITSKGFGCFTLLNKCCTKAPHCLVKHPGHLTGKCVAFYQIDYYCTIVFTTS